MKKVIYIGAFIILLAGIPLSLKGQEGRSYNYDFVSVSIKINEDSTFDVEESLVFNYQGSYHSAWRSIPFRKIDAITDISVWDGAVNQPLDYSSKKLDKLNPQSWGKYTYFREGGAQNIEWYYDLANTRHIWNLRYKVHGGIAFGKNADRLYWNIFTDYDMPVNLSIVTVELPRQVNRDSVLYYAYRNHDSPISQSYDAGIFSFSSASFYPKEAFTIDVSWPKGLVSQGAYWRDFAKIYYGYIGGAIALLLAFGVGFWFWLKREKLPKGRGTIVPQYEPPQHLPPAMAEVITKEKLTPKGLAATIIDLAVRGYVKIEEDKRKILFFSTFDYVIKKLGDFDSSDLQDYEKKYLKMLFDGSNEFSTKKLKNNRGQARELYEKTKKLKYEIYKETQIETEAFEISPLEERIKTRTWIGLMIGLGVILVAIVAKKDFILRLAWDVGGRLVIYLFMFAIVGIYYILKKDKSGRKRMRKTLKYLVLALVCVLLATALIVLSQTDLQLSFLIGFVLVGASGLFVFIKYEARLNEEGRILKEEWLGFKMYLEVAERYRMQKLTPELFEKYLPYAMIFGVEKKWAKAFEALHLPPPSWYAGGVYISGSSAAHSSVSSFSPSAFSASFSSAFTSAFASSGAGGGGAGGGGAGGGGGGGGGGAG